MKKTFLRSIVFAFLALGSCYFLANQALARTSSAWNKVGISGMESDGTQWSYGGINALVVYKNELYAGGDFATVDGITVNHIAKWNGTNWSLVGTSGTEIGSTIYGLAVYNDELYVGGDFITMDGITVNYIAKWNGTNWSKVGISGMNSIVTTLGAYNNELYAGGLFTAADGISINRIAKWNGANWSAVGTSGMNQYPDVLAVYNNELYAGGHFTIVDDITVNYIAKWNGSNWSKVGLSGMNSRVYSLAVYQNELYAGGELATADGITVNGIAKWNGINWSQVGTSGLGTMANRKVNALAVYNNELYIGGHFYNVDDTVARRIAKWNGTSWSKVGIFGVNSTVNALAVYNNELYTGGYFYSADGITTKSIASWYIDYIAPITTASPAGGTYTSDQIVTLSATDTDSTVTGTYYTTDGSTPTTSSNVYSSPITISEDTTLKFFSVDGPGNIEDVKTEVYTISIPVTPTPFSEKIDLKDTVLNQIYESNEANADLTFYKLPKAKVINKLYTKLNRNKKKYLGSFTKKNSYPGYLKLSSNIGTVKKAYSKKVNKHINFNVAIRYSKTKLDKTKIKEKDLRLFIKDRDNNWRGPYRIYQNKTSHTIKFKIRNYLIKTPKNTIPNPLDITTKNRPFAPTFYFRTLEKVKFVIASKDALSNLTNSEITEEQNLDFE
ncbi:MAG: chitobiase/beta-hexosaminidase C-terminal domain-containing protein [Patescibacteria group bacterium]|nr:chitobiase/beta-hexosaminidase C-terminal domain-containing protein [Patescibacteria group bacterium]